MNDHKIQSQIISLLVKVLLNRYHSINNYTTKGLKLNRFGKDSSNSAIDKGVR